MDDGAEEMSRVEERFESTESTKAASTDDISSVGHDLTKSTDSQIDGASASSTLQGSLDEKESDCAESTYSSDS